MYYRVLDEKHEQFRGLCVTPHTGTITPAFYTDKIPLVDVGGKTPLDRSQISELRVFGGDLKPLEDKFGRDEKFFVSTKWQTWRASDPELKKFAFRIGSLPVTRDANFGVLRNVLDTVHDEAYNFQAPDEKGSPWAEEDKWEDIDIAAIDAGGATAEAKYTAQQQILDRRLGQDVQSLLDAMKPSNIKATGYLFHMCMFVWRAFSSHILATAITNMALDNLGSRLPVAIENIASQTAHWERVFLRQREWTNKITRIGVSAGKAGCHVDVVFR